MRNTITMDQIVLFFFCFDGLFTIVLASPVQKLPRSRVEDATAAGVSSNPGQLVLLVVVPAVLIAGAGLIYWHCHRQPFSKFQMPSLSKTSSLNSSYSGKTGTTQHRSWFERFRRNARASPFQTSSSPLHSKLVTVPFVDGVSSTRMRDSTVINTISPLKPAALIDHFPYAPLKPSSTHIVLDRHDLLQGEVRSDASTRTGVFRTVSLW